MQLSGISLKDNDYLLPQVELPAKGKSVQTIKICYKIITSQRAKKRPLPDTNYETHRLG